MVDVSVIVPVYNAEKTIEKTIESISAQIGTFSGSIEIIIIDDGSTDRSRDICQKICSEHSSNIEKNAGDTAQKTNNQRIQFKYKHIPNGGVSNARNIGMEQATGKYIMFVDADDTLESDALCYMIDAIRDDESIAFASMTGSKDESGEAITGTEYINTKLLYKDTHVWGKIFRKKHINGVKFKDGLTIGEDMLFLLNIASNIQNVRCIKCLPDQKYNYLDNETGAMKVAFKKSYTDQLKCWQMAEQKIAYTGVRLTPKAKISLSCSQIMAAMLLVGKLSQVKEDQDQKIEIDIIIKDCKDQIKKSLNKKGTFASLENGYKIKVILFLINPKLYMRMYGNWKK